MQLGGTFPKLTPPAALADLKERLKSREIQLPEYNARWSAIMEGVHRSDPVLFTAEFMAQVEEQRGSRSEEQHAVAVRAVAVFAGGNTPDSLQELKAASTGRHTATKDGALRVHQTELLELLFWRARRLVV